MITEFTKPWNDSKVWFDYDELSVVIKPGTTEIFTKYSTNHQVCIDSIEAGSILIHNENSESQININPREINEIAIALKKAFTEFNKQKYPFLCPSCKYGRLLRICHEHPHYGEPMCICKTTISKEVINEKGMSPNKEFEFIMSSQLLDYEDGPGGWDGKTCANYVKKEELFTETFG